MADYILGTGRFGGVVIRTADGANIPADPDNVDWQAYQAWLKTGSVPDPYVEPAISPIITRVQALLWLLDQGKTDADVQKAIATIQDPKAQAQASIAWNYSLDYHREHPLFDALAPLLGISPDQLDIGFQVAAKL